MKTLSKKLLSLLLTIAIVLQLLPAVVFAEETNGTEELSIEEILAMGSSEPAEPAQILFEEEALREADTKHYRMSDGSFHAVQFEEPVHYLDEDGLWQEINNILTPTTTYSGDTLYSVANAADGRSFAGTLTEEPFFSLTGNGHSLSFALTDLSLDHMEMDDNASLVNPGLIQPCTAEISAVTPDDSDTASEPNYLPEGYASAVTYPEVYPGVDLKYELLGLHVKESIIVKTLQEDYSFDFLMDLDGLIAIQQEDGSIELTDERGTPLYYIPAPYMVDADGKYSEAVTHELISLPAGGCLLRVEADGEWIENAQLPVTIDPTIYKIVDSDADSNSKIISNYISSGNPDSDCSNGQELYAGYTNANNNAELQIISHINELPELPKGSTVNAAMLSYNQSSFSIDNSSQDYLLLEAYELKLTKPSEYSSYTAWIDSLTWNTVHPNNTANYDADELLDFAKMSDASTGKAVVLDLTKIAREWYADQDTNTTLLLKTDASSTKRIVTTLSMYNLYNKNYLKIVYRNDVGLESYYTYQTQGIGRAGTGYLSDHTQRLTLVNTLMNSPSNVMPFGLSLVYNSSYGTRYFDADTDIHCQDYSGMILGAGWKLSVQECILPVTLDGDDTATLYWVYTDGDGTEHFFHKEGNVWKDEDGLGLQLEQVAESGHTNYKLTDEKGNEKFFRDGLLAYVKDAYGNAIYYVYNDKTFSVSLASGKTWMPTKTEDKNRLTDIYRINKGCTSAELLAEIVYDQNNNDLITGIYDEAHRKTILNHETVGDASYLTVLTYPDGQTVNYGYTSGRLTTAYDNEAGYGIEYAYTSAGQVSQFREYVKNGANILYGSSFSCWAGYANRSSYRYWGKDNINDATKPENDTSPDDDLRTELIFDNSGRTVCTYATSSDMTEILGSSALSYTENSGISKQNNRITASASAGMTAVNLLPYSSLEGENNPSGWVKSCSGTGSNAAVSTATGHRRLHGSGGINLYLPATAAAGDYAGIQRAVSLKANTAYTLSGWFSVSEYLTWDEDSKLEILWLDSSGSIRQRSTVALSAPTSGIEGGWQRVFDTFVAPAGAYYTAQFRLSGCTGTAYLDNLQLEEAETASSFNLVQDGSFEQANGTWTLASNMSLSDSTGTPFGGKGLSVTGEKVGTQYASQAIPLNVPANTTFLLSGWAKANAAPNGAQKYTDSTDRFFGLILTILYTDGISETHSVPFVWASGDWHSVAKAIAPEHPEKTIDRVYVNCAYNNNSGTAVFDNISLRQEPVQTYTYNANGKPEAVTQPGSEETNYTYDGADLTSYLSSNNVKYEYEYNDQHDVIEASSDGVTANYTYNAMGNMTASLLTGGTLTMSSSATYTANGNHTASAMDTAGNTTQYSYVENRELLGAITNAKGQTTNYSYPNNSDRTQMVYQSGIAAVTYTYDGAQLSQLDRKTFQNGTEQHQYYNFAYNLWGQSTSIKVGTIPLASYEYADVGGNEAGTGGGLMSKMIYDSENYIEYSYDSFDRLIQMRYNDTGNYVTYLYSADGALAELQYRKSSGALIAAYTFEYDSLGRLIRSAEYNASGLVQRTEHLYDEHNRLSSQAWSIQGDDFSESYTYNDPDPTVENAPGDGSLLRMTTATGDKINYSYNGLKMRSGTSVTDADTNAELFKTGYEYKQVSGNQTPLIEQREVTANSKLISGLRYSYDALGNILGIYESELIEGNQYRRPLNIYTYDDQNQLLTETVYTYDEDNDTSTPTETIVCTYTYDTAGNILSKTETVNGTATTVAYTYGNSQWNDLLTKYNGKQLAYEGQTIRSTTNKLTGAVTKIVSGTPTSGNPTLYYNGTQYDMQWEQGRNLSRSYHETVDNSASSQLQWIETENTSNYAYDADGIRISKSTTVQTYRYKTSSGGTEISPVSEDGAEQNASTDALYTRYLASTKIITHTYVTQNGKVVRETIGSGTTAKVLDFIYDESGRPFALIYTNGTATPATYYYVLNLQGDVVGLLDENGTPVAYYSYNAWGEITQIKGLVGESLISVLESNPDHIANINPLRYRGYYYDTETGFYYLQSRYYDPVTHRFINADVYIKAATSLLGYNMFCYCLNNPGSRTDIFGQLPGDLFDSADEAAEDFGNCYNGDSINNEREYGTYIYSVEVIEPRSISIFGYTLFSWETKKTYYSYCDPIEGEAYELEIPWQDSIDGNTAVAMAHTHGKYSPEHLNEMFSAADCDYAFTNDVVVYIISPAGKLWKFDPFTEYPDGVEICNDIIHDPASPDIAQSGFLFFKSKHEDCCELCAYILE